MFLNTRLACSFCGKRASEVSKLVAGPKVYVCDVCVATASRIMSDTGGTTSQALLPSPTRWQRLISQLSRLLGWPSSRDSRVLFVTQ
jgi:ATP-dependent protease Clp ATPase subunit